jgi:UDP-N-acetylglucosamine--N-acetylmuramyl-(pentapeptide) pyrophosphoryl-undecaprenol N-acetylglucosamine transferase
MAPALAVAEELAARGAVVSFVTTPSQVPLVAEKYATYELAMRGFERRPLSRQNLTTLRLLAAAAPRAWRHISAARPACVIGGGGYVSGPVAALAAVRGIPTVAMEADSHLGVTNRLLRPFAGRIFLSFPITGLEPPKFVVTGRPLARHQLEATAAAGREAFGLSADVPTLLVFGGSQGAQRLNRACLDAFARPDLDIQVVHVCGPRNHDAVSAELASLGAPLERYHLLAYTDRLADAMAAADLVVGRSGGSLAEIAALGRPAVLVPYPYASADHQSKNAEWMARAGAAEVVADADMTGDLLSRLVRELLGDRPRLAAMAAAGKALGRPDATSRVADEIEKLLGAARRREDRK